MAIVPGCPGLVVEVLVDGVPLQEYNDDEDEEGSPGITTKYIEAHSGSSFTIRFSYANSLPVHPHLVRISLDGQRIYTRFYLNSVPRQKHAIESRISKIGEQTVCRKFQFRELDISTSNFVSTTSTVTDSLELTGTPDASTKSCLTNSPRLAPSRLLSRAFITSLTIPAVGSP